MQKIHKIDRIYLVSFLTGVLKIPSPTGFADKTVNYTAEALLTS